MKRILTFIIFSTTVLLCNAQEDFTERYRQFKSKSRNEYNKFRDDCNKKYAEFIKQSWQTFKGEKPIEIPKEEPVPPIVYDDKKEEEKNEIIEIESTPADTIPDEQPKPVAPIIEDKEKQQDKFNFKFYGTDCQIRFSQKDLFKLDNSDKDNLAKAWEFCSQNYNNIIRDCLTLRIKHNLCDWAYLQMLEKISQEIFGGICNESTFMTAFIYCQSGYQMRMAQSNNKLYMMVASKHDIYNRTFYIIDGSSYYPLNCDAQSLEVCQASYPGEQPLSLWITKEPRFEQISSETRELKSGKYPQASIEVTVNQNLLDFYNTYPTSEINNNFMTRWAMYAKAPLDKNISSQIYPALKASIEGKSLKEQANILLNFVQTAFEYEYDSKVWGVDRAFFVEETLFYPYCDCEDRSILFSRLIHDLLGLEVALIYYPGHLATAVCFGEETYGDHITLENRKFTICDPTYIGAPVGSTMPNFKDAKIIANLLNE